MLVKTFKAEKVFGYLDLNIIFNEDINFLVGGNGSGKTTALKLINALIVPDFDVLLLMPYKKVELEVLHKDELILISSEEKEGGIILKISSLPNSELFISLSAKNEYGLYSDEVGVGRGLFGEFADHDVSRGLLEMQSPVFLGLDRRWEKSKVSKEDYARFRGIPLPPWVKTGKRGYNDNRLIEGLSNPSLLETARLVQETYRRLRHVEDRQSIKLRDSILLSSFQYSTVNEDSFSISASSFKDKFGILERQKDIKAALLKIEGNSSELSSKVDEFFNQVKPLFEKLSNEKSSNFKDVIPLEWLLNVAQLERISAIVKIIDDHKSKIDSLYKPINDFLNTINEFYKDSSKKLIIDTVGRLIVNPSDDVKSTIECLSSGERQLLVIFSHAFLNNKSNRKMVFVVDEPELSLHLKWQEKFAETIFSINPNIQFILATHSPEIIGINKHKAIWCR